MFGGETSEQRNAREIAEQRAQKFFKLQLAFLKKQELYLSEQAALMKRQEAATMESLGYVWKEGEIIETKVGPLGRTRKTQGEGKWVKGPQTEAQKRADNIRKLLQERQLAALEGNAPVDPALERDIAKSKEIALRQAEEVGGMESTAGRQIMARFNEWANIVRSKARQGEIGLGGGLLSQRTGQELQRQGLTLQGLQMPTQAGFQYGGLLNQSGGVLAQISSQYQFPYPPGKQNLWGQGLSLAGGILGGIYGGGGGAYLGSQLGGLAGTYFGDGQYPTGGYGYYNDWEKQKTGGFKEPSGYYYPV